MGVKLNSRTCVYHMQFMGLTLSTTASKMQHKHREWIVLPKATEVRGGTKIQTHLKHESTGGPDHFPSDGNTALLRVLPISLNFPLTFWLSPWLYPSLQSQVSLLFGI